MPPDPRAPIRDAVRDALRSFETGSLRGRAEELLGILGYESERCAEDFAFGPDGFLEWADEEAPGRRIATRLRELIRDTWGRIQMVFQYTDDDLVSQADLFGARRLGYDKSQAESFLFLAVDLNDGDYPRQKLAAMTRAINRPLMMPAIVFFRYRRHDGSTALTLAVIHRRPHRRDTERDVLERATLIKDIRVVKPHRAHVSILTELTLASLALEETIHTFDALHRAWERVLDAEKLNKRFYKKLFKWFERAVSDAHFPPAAPIEQQVIRLITRVLFVWFIKEKRLVADEWFSETKMRALLRDFGGSDYYRAVLQNLFFATLNTPMDERGFSQRTRRTHRVFSRYRYRTLIRDIGTFRTLMGQTPFINGGLFDCLDDALSRSEGGARIDMFSDPDPRRGPEAAEARQEAWEQLHVPDRLFFGRDGLFSLFQQYKFTVEENTPIDQEVALDPELLGRAFENLLAAHNPETRKIARERKRTGSFYTPRQIVDYMVDQSLIAVLQNKAQPEDGDPSFWRDRLRYLLDFADAGELFEDEDKKAVVRAIAELTVLDPAVGSGAFAMAMLQKLTLALRRLDEDNRIWQDVQKERAVKQAESAFEVPAKSARDAALLEISETFSRYTGDFGRKLYLIQNSIFGVDIQPIACQIARLRFFISLAIEQEPDRSANNLGIRPLPNLETRFVSAQTLLGLKRQKRMLASPRVHEIEEELSRNREVHFHAQSRSQKLACINRDEQLRTALAGALSATGMPAGVARQVSEWDPYNQNHTSDWFDAEYMFGVKQGFDIVIGNPPYVRADFPDPRHVRARERIMESGQYVTLWEKWDLYVAFIERAFDLLSHQGVLTFIVSDAYSHAKYAQKSREWFLKSASILRLDFVNQLRVFDAAVRNLVFVYQKSLDQSSNRPHRRLHTVRFGNVTELPTDRQRNLTERTFFPEDTAVLDVRVCTVTLDQICYISVGMVANAHEERAPGEFQLVDLVTDVQDERHPKRFVEGKHLARWVPATHVWLEWGTPRAPGLFRRPTFPEMYDVEEKLIAQRSPGPDPVTCLDTEQSRFPESCVGFVLWHALSGVRNRSIKLKARYHNEKSRRPDLPLREVLEDISTRFSPMFLLGVMNSSAARSLLRAGRRSNIHLYPKDWAKLPIPDCDKGEQAPIVETVNAILDAKRRNSEIDVTVLESDLDLLVNGLYGLSDHGGGLETAAIDPTPARLGV